MQAEIYWIPGVRLAIMPRPRGGDWLEDEIDSLKQAGVNVLLSLLDEEEVEELDLAREEACCQASGIDFLSFPIVDRGVPESRRKTLALAEQLQERLKQGAGVAIHCRQGMGRSAVIAACILCQQGESWERAFQRIAEARGCAVPDTDEQRDWLARLVKPA